MASSFRPKKPHDYQVYGGLAGTAITGIAKSLDGNSTLKAILLWSVPAATLFITWVSKRVIMHFDNIQLKDLTEQYIAEIELALNEPDLSRGRKDALTKKLDEIKSFNIIII